MKNVMCVILMFSIGLAPYFVSAKHNFRTSSQGPSLEEIELQSLELSYVSEALDQAECHNGQCHIRLAGSLGLGMIAIRLVMLLTNPRSQIFTSNVFEHYMRRLPTEHLIDDLKLLQDTLQDQVERIDIMAGKRLTVFDANNPDVIPGNSHNQLMGSYQDVTEVQLQTRPQTTIDLASNPPSTMSSPRDPFKSTVSVVKKQIYLSMDSLSKGEAFRIVERVVPVDTPFLSQGSESFLNTITESRSMSMHPRDVEITNTSYGGHSYTSHSVNLTEDIIKVLRKGLTKIALPVMFMGAVLGPVFMERLHASEDPNTITLTQEEFNTAREDIRVAEEALEDLL